MSLCLLGAAARRASTPLASSVRMCSTMGRRTDGSAEDAYFQKMNRERLARLKAKKGVTINEADEGMRLDTILDTVIATDGTKGVRSAIRDALKVQLLLWKHDEDMKK